MYKNAHGEYSYFYSANFKLQSNEIITNFNAYHITDFLNPTKGIKQVVNTIYNYDEKLFQGPINYGISNENYSIAISRDLAIALKVYNGDVIYFRLKQ